MPAKSKKPATGATTTAAPTPAPDSKSQTSPLTASAKPATATTTADSKTSHAKSAAAASTNPTATAAGGNDPPTAAAPHAVAGTGTADAAGTGAGGATAAAKKKKKKKKAGGDASGSADGGGSTKGVADVKRVNPYDSLKVVPLKPAPPINTTSKDGLTRKVNDHQSAFSFYIAHTEGDNVGRRAIANHDIKVGSQVLKERPFPWIVHWSHAKVVCHNCATLLSGARDCASCHHAHYCSAACQTAHAPIHSVECKALSEIERISDVARVNVDLVRVALRILVNRKLPPPLVPLTKQTVEQSATATAAAVDVKSAAAAVTAAAAAAAAAAGPLPFQCEWADVMAMVSHSEHFSESDMKNTTTAAEMITALLPAEYALDPKILVDFMGRVNNNCHSLNLESDPNIQFGLGLFPLCALFNHSCFPNVLYTNEGNQLVFRVIRDIKAGEELLVNYIGLYQSRWARREELLISKRFLCRCNRCSLTPTTEEEVAAFKADQYIGAIFCKNRKPAGAAGAKGCDGFYRETSVIDPPSIDQHNTTEISGAGKILIPAPVRSCSACGHKADPVWCQLIEDRAKKALAEAENVYQTKDSRAVVSRAKLEAVIKEFTEILHPNHELFFNLSLPLINCCGHLRDYRAKWAHCQLVVQNSEAAWPALFSPKTNYLIGAADTLMQLLGSKTAATPKKSLLAYRQQRIDLLEKTANIYRVCFGEKHVLTIKAVQNLQGAKATRI